MFDFTWSEHTLGNVLYCATVYGIFVLLFYKRYVNDALSRLSSRPNPLLLFFSFLLIITACIGTDWFNYREMVQGYDMTTGAINYGEPIYRFIIVAVKRNYLFFRIAVWGLAFGLTCLLFKRFEINLNIAVFFLIAVFLIKFNYARASLGMASYYLGLSFLIIPSKKPFFLRILLAAVFLGGAYEFHHSMLLLIILTPFVFIPMDKPIVAIVVLLAIPYIISLLNNNFYLIDRLGNDYISNKMDRYLEREGTVANVFGIIQNILSYGAFVIPIAMDTLVVARNRLLPRPILKLYRLTISTTILSVSILLMNLDSTVFFYRILYMTFIPITILTIYFFEQHYLSRKNYKVIVIWGMAAVTYVLLHLLYVYR